MAVVRITKWSMESVKVKCVNIIYLPISLLLLLITKYLFNVSKYIKACPPGYYGNNCSVQCPFPSFGLKCLEECNCSHSECDPDLGCRKYGNMFIFFNACWLKYKMQRFYPHGV